MSRRLQKLNKWRRKNFNNKRKQNYQQFQDNLIHSSIRSNIREIANEVQIIPAPNIVICKACGKQGHNWMKCRNSSKVAKLCQQNNSNFMLQIPHSKHLMDLETKINILLNSSEISFDIDEDDISTAILIMVVAELLALMTLSSISVILILRLIIGLEMEFLEKQMALDLLEGFQTFMSYRI